MPSDILSSLSDCGFLVAAGGGLTNTLSVSPSSFFWPTQASSSSPKARTCTLLLVTLTLNRERSVKVKTGRPYRPISTIVFLSGPFARSLILTKADPKYSDIFVLFAPFTCGAFGFPSRSAPGARRLAANAAKRCAWNPVLLRLTFAMLSAVMVCLVGAVAGAIVIIRCRHVGPGPFVQDGKKPGDVLDDLPGVLTAEVTPEAWLPQCDSAIDQIVVGCVRCFHRRPHGRLAAVPCLWSSASESHR